MIASIFFMVTLLVISSLEACRVGARLSAPDPGRTAFLQIVRALSMLAFVEPDILFFRVSPDAGHRFE